MSGPRFDDDLNYWVDNPDEREEEPVGYFSTVAIEDIFHVDREYPPGFWPADSFGAGYPEGYRHAKDCRCSDCNT